ncbi:MAG: hypothetical protein KIT73_19015 [Burkholderiales bacterium]|nr:hypothetical protein [Burkholderiales bacterium]
MKNPSKFLFPLTAAATVCVVVSSSIGVAAITGQRTASGIADAAGTGASISRPAAAVSPDSCAGCGVVQSVETMTAEALIAAAGGPIGTRTPSTGLGLNMMPGTARGAGGFVIRLRMDDGSVRVIQEHLQPSFTVGQRVRLINGLVITLG